MCAFLGFSDGETFSLSYVPESNNDSPAECEASGCAITEISGNGGNY